MCKKIDSKWLQLKKYWAGRSHSHKDKKLKVLSFLHNERTWALQNGRIILGCQNPVEGFLFLNNLAGTPQVQCELD